MLPLLLLVFKNHMYLKWNKRSIGVNIRWNLEGDELQIAWC